MTWADVPGEAENTMKIPIIRGLIDRRILVNYRVDPEVLALLLPPPFRPKIVHGFGMVGICLIRLRSIRPKGLPAWLGISSENAAHRSAVEWDEQGTAREGVFIRRRDTNSRLNALAGGRLFPGVHHHAQFTVHETASHFDVALRSDDGETSMAVEADLADHFPAGSLFGSLAEASEFFQAGSLGYSVTSCDTTFQGMELRCPDWNVEPLTVSKVDSSFFGDSSVFPAGSISFDCALLMRAIEHEWHGQRDLCCDKTAAAELAVAT
jgi:hypothetical protein